MIEDLITRLIGHYISKTVSEEEEKTNANYREDILNAETAEEAMELRKEYKRHKKAIPFDAVVISVIMIIITIIIAIFLKHQTINWDILPYIVAGIIIYTLVRSYLNNVDNVESVSVHTKSEYLSSHKNFILYLRPFDSDKYDNFLSTVYIVENEDGELEPTIKTRTFPTFSEKMLVDELEQVQSATVCAIGMTKEAEHPDGATRIYVSDKTWQQDVIELMEKAKSIIILVANKDSCIWEIEQAYSHLKKTIFIIEDQEHYSLVKEKISHKMELPSLPQNEDNSQHFVLSYPDGKLSINEYSHTIDGYKTISNALIKTILPLDVNGFFNIIDKGFREIIDPNLQPRDMLSEMKEALNKRLPLVINNQIKIDNCDFIDDNRFFIYCTLNDDLIDFNQAKNNTFPIKNYLIEQFIAETCDDFQNLILMFYFSFDIVFESKMHNDIVHISIDSSTLDKRIDQHMMSVQYGASTLPLSIIQK